ncbi:hypothetical protein CAPTEDRAFT_217422 [Capitella teleta]|uniref:Uncharacterized protein n=1 Tax=Capitella teleta TaxID=283909 RepID=R7TTK3_CAPTE|nr:hypothetical protein CAPTEDRAFT_217422 [Capitella teleta]|eukprot:ELT94320.1 hypothetical protein CAPTEDRAFT_217422 [Capitella teleta]
MESMSSNLDASNQHWSNVLKKYSLEYAKQNILNGDRRINLCGLNPAIRLTSGVDRVADVTKGYLHSVIGSMRIYDSEEMEGDGKSVCGAKGGKPSGVSLAMAITGRYGGCIVLACPPRDKHAHHASGSNHSDPLPVVSEGLHHFAFGCLSRRRWGHALDLERDIVLTQVIPSGNVTSHS